MTAPAVYANRAAAALDAYPHPDREELEQVELISDLITDLCYLLQFNGADVDVILTTVQVNLAEEAEE